MVNGEAHEGRWSTVATQKAEPFNVAIGIYTYSREGRIVTTSKLRLTRKEVKALLVLMERAEDEQSQMTIPWAQEGDDNIRWLPPQP